MHLIKWGLAAVILSIRIAKEVFHKGNNCMHNININIATKSKVALSHLLRDLRLLFGFTTDIHRQFMICNNANPNHQINIWKQYCCPQKDNFTSLAARPRSKYLVKWTKHVSVNSRKKVENISWNFLNIPIYFMSIWRSYCGLYIRCHMWWTNFCDLYDAFCEDIHKIENISFLLCVSAAKIQM